jgi:hypothetical protein
MLTVPDTGIFANREFWPWMQSHESAAIFGVVASLVIDFAPKSFGDAVPDLSSRSSFDAPVASTMRSLQIG